MRYITEQRAKEICDAWHGGQWSAIYQYASSGIFVRDNALRYVMEVLKDMYPEYWCAWETDVPTKDMRELRSLVRYFIKVARENDIPITLEKHPVYGYEFPVTTANIEPLKLPV